MSERRSHPSPDEYGPIDEEPQAPDLPRRRGGRAAIRSRGGERAPETGRSRDQSSPPPGAERFAPGAADEEIERYRSAEFEPPALQERGRGAEPRESPRERTRPHNRAGEPGYVPRRERLRSVEPEPGDEPPPSAFGWPTRQADLDADIESPEFLAPEEEPPGRPRPAGSAADAREGKRRRRRRGRRRERERPELEAPAPAGEESPPEFEDLGPEPGYGPSFPRRPANERFIGGKSDELDLDIEDLEDDAEAEDIAIEEEEGVIDDEYRAQPARIAEEEIDPELEQEIRKEIEEIEELEREMGLRGPVDARPGRSEDVGRGGRSSGRGRGMVKPPIQEIFRRGDEVLVQVIKESIGTKGPTLSTYISIPGRYLVLMPGLNRVGVSRKIVDEGQRRKLREIMHELNPPKGLGFIVRTAGLERTKRELARDLAYLLRLWKVILRRIKRTRTPGPIYQESDMITRTIRDIFTSEIDTIWIDEPSAFETRSGVPPRGHAPVRQPDQALRGKGAALPQVRHRGRDRQDPAPPCPPPRGRLDRHRPDRGFGGDRRQFGELPGRGRRRENRLRDEPSRRQGDCSPAPAPRPRRRDRQRLHRHARGAAQPWRGTSSS